MALGPVEYVVISFPGNRFSGQIAPQIANLVKSGTVRILDLAFVRKNADGVAASFEFSDLDEGAAFVEVDGDVDGLLGNEDIASVAAALEPNSSALFILWEDPWAADLARAVLDDGGELLVGERIPHAAMEAALAGLSEA